MYLAGIGLALAAPAAARDYGQHGAVFPVIEPDLLRMIETRLKHLEATGQIDRVNQSLADRTARKVNRPDPVPGIVTATSPRTWRYDPAITIDHDVSDTRGHLIAHAGQRVSPLDFIKLRQALVFIDGDDMGQLRWAMNRYTAENAKIIMVKGAPLEAMTAHQRPFFFDQSGYLVDRFGIRAVPAVVEQAGVSLKVSEIPLKAGGR